MTDTDEDMVLCGRGLDKWYGAKHDRRQVLFGVDVDVRAGECLAVIGGSGSGKSSRFAMTLRPSRFSAITAPQSGPGTHTG